MASKRLRKKQAKQKVLASLSAPEPISPFAVQAVVSTVPCPECAHPTVNRRYLPAAGNLNGSAECPRCHFEAPFLQFLAVAMSEEDPLPAPFTPRTPLPSLPPPSLVLHTASPWTRFVRWASTAQVVVGHWLGIRRRWRFA